MLGNFERGRVANDVECIEPRSRIRKEEMAEKEESDKKRTSTMSGYVERVGVNISSYSK